MRSHHVERAELYRWVRQHEPPLQIPNLAPLVRERVRHKKTGTSYNVAVRDVHQEERQGDGAPGGARDVSLGVLGALMGAVLFRLLVAIAIRMGLEANDLKLVTAVVVLVAIVAPDRLRRFTRRGAGRRGSVAST